LASGLAEEDGRGLLCAYVLGILGREEC